MLLKRLTMLVLSLMAALALLGCSDGTDNPRTLPTAGPDYQSPSEIGPNTESGTFPEGDGSEGGTDSGEGSESSEGE